MDKSTDPLGYDVYAKTLWARIQTALNKDEGGKPLGDDPLVVGIFGEWGAGKSYLLTLVQKLADEELERQRKLRLTDEGFSLTVPVFFQPWKYEHEDHLHVPFVMHVFEALKEAIKRSQTTNEHWLQWLEAKWDKLLPHLPVSVNLFEKLLLDSLTAGTGSSQMKWGLKAVSWLSKLPPIKSPQRSNLADRYKFSGDGHYYRHIQEALKAVTRPCQHPDLLQGFRLLCNPKINFVVFIDDLDRCLPEKAVQTLELIKTVFNVESFAFVLALDDEVIERGISHRYKEYKLQDKKPEMPITGFEYLEKIVHLPFRLPALTQEQALSFIRSYEREIEPNGAKRWFDGLVLANRTIKTGESEDQVKVLGQSPIDLWPLVRISFDAYVPRKLIRLIELLHQTAAIAHERGKPLNRTTGGQVDVRVVLALILIQLFQPELYRLMRRRTDIFPFLLAAFAKGKLNNAHVSDIDLLAWAVEPKIRRAIDNAHDSPKPPHSLDEAVQAITDLHADQRADAQQVLLPLVTQLIEHRAVQRHVFDVLKLFSELARNMGGPANSLTIAPYFSLLGKNDESTVLPRAMQTKVARPSYTVIDIQMFFNDWISEDETVVANIISRNDIPQGHVLSAESAKKLLEKAKLDTQDRKKLLNGLQYLAPCIAQEDGAIFWSLVSDLGKDWLPNPSTPNTITSDPVNASLYLDVRCMLGQDDRFDRDETQDENGKTLKPLYLLKNRWNQNDEKQEPIPGFVLIPAGIYPVGQPDKTVTGYKLEYDIYLARTPVTVDQFGVFIADGGYGENANDENAQQYWDEPGWAWRHNTEAYKIKLSSLDEKSRHFSEYRAGELRALPWEWADQQRIGSRAVGGINWFEARAYVRWLNAQLKQRGVFRSTLANYGATLPNESEWEIAARAQMQETYDWNHWPWGNDDGLSGQRANISSSHIDHVSVPGCFAPNDWGLLDMAGNVFEWQDVLFSNNPHVSTLDWGNNVAVPTSSSSFFTDLDSASCSSRAVNPAVHGGNYVGLRVMLSQRGLNN